MAWSKGKAVGRITAWSVGIGTQVAARSEGAGSTSPVGGGSVSAGGVTGGSLRRGLLAGAVAGASMALLAGAAASVMATYLARRVVSPDVERPDDVQVLGVGVGTVTLRASDETIVPGRYGLWLDGGDGHVQLGEVVDHDDVTRTVTRRVLGGDSGRLREGPARWDQYFFTGTPKTRPRPGLHRGGAGRRTRAAACRPGRCPRRQDAGPGHLGGARARARRHQAGVPAGDPGAAPARHRGSGQLSQRRRSRPQPGGRYHLGDAEWLDVEAAVLYAVEQGAADVALVGWSMGGAIALQTVSRSWLADRVRAFILDAPVLDWRDVLDHHARLNRVPSGIGRLSQVVLEHPQARRLAGVDAPVSL